MMKTTCIVLLCAFATSGSFAVAPYPGNDADHGVSRSEGFVDPYTGNLSFATQDLVIAGAVGQHGLTWKRHATSRTSQTEKFFGLGHNWAHNWQWEMADAGKDDQGRAVVSVREPQGWSHRFTETSPGQWWPAPSVQDRLVSSGDSFVIRRLDGGEIRFVRTSSGRRSIFVLDKVVDYSGLIWEFAYEAGRLGRITEPTGRWIQIGYDVLSAASTAKAGDGFTVISQVTASDGQVVNYRYEFPAGADYPVLAGVTYPEGSTATYTYAAPRAGARMLLTEATDPHCESALRGRTIKYRAEPDAAAGQMEEIRAKDSGARMSSLSSDGRDPRVFTITSRAGAEVYRGFNPGGILAAEIDALGYAKKHEFDAGGRGFKIATIDELGKRTQFENDANGHRTKTIFPDGSTRSADFDSRGRLLAETDELGQTRHYDRDTLGRITRIRLPDGGQEARAYNAFGQVLSRTDTAGAKTVFEYNNRGLLRTITDALGASSSRTYDVYDRHASSTDANGNTTRFERDAAGRLVKTIYADGATTAVSYDNFGQITQTIDMSGGVRARVYDNYGRLVATRDPNGRETAIHYPAPGANGPFERPIGMTTPSGQLTRISYDAAGRKSALIVGAETTEAATTRFSYDAAGRQTAVTNPLGKTVQFFYDDRGRLIKAMSALNYATLWTYDAAGRKLSETDAKGNTTRWTYDALGRELTKVNAKGEVTRRDYDRAGRLVALTDARLNVNRFEYDLLGRQTALIFPDGGRETANYDEAGHKLRRVNSAGIVQSFTYDNRGREVVSEWSDGSEKVIKAYDAAGRMILADNGVSKLTFAYDAAGRLTQETQDPSPLVSDGAFDPAPRTVSYTYDSDGRRQTLGYPDGSSVVFTYNARGQLEGIFGEGTAPAIARYEYDATGNATRMPRENDTATTREFDAENRLVGIVEHAGNRRSLVEMNYVYDEVGNRTGTTEAFESDRGTAASEIGRQDYGYDATNQLTDAGHTAPMGGGQADAAAGRVRFTYDAAGNRVQVDIDGKVTRYTANNLNQYTQVGDFAPTYDRNGNLSGMGRWLYQFDAMNRLISASDGSMTVKCYYDAKNRCVARSYNGRVALNSYDGWNLIEEYDARDTQLARYVHGRRVDEIVMMANRHGVFYPHHDVLGNVTMLTGANGRLVERYSYSADGKVTINDAAGTVLAQSAVGNRWMFTGREWLAEIKLYDYRNRVYSAELGRFLQRDPIRFRASDVNIYRYVKNSYVNYTDPTGLDWFRQDTEEYLAGRPGTLVVPGELVSTIIEDWVPAGHTFAENHDAFVGWAVNEMGVPDLFANVPSMPIVYAVSFVQEVIETVGDFFGWLFTGGE